jgi:hypothetical protein
MLFSGDEDSKETLYAQILRTLDPNQKNKRPKRKRKKRSKQARLSRRKNR